MLGVDEGQYGLVLRTEFKGKKQALPYYVVMTDRRNITQWMTCFVDVISEPLEF